ncbi:hypothetical protein EYF80_042000 [Liparis tanakae]|uniref:Uncharacterized protein n=1 Tax=Liparis tanakae TaxID=230148 RepID=A0A4Z2G4I6_9TELE|nr:hypothetical protein EYF80_042000 [Liparis tanakae]
MSMAGSLSPRGRSLRMASRGAMTLTFALTSLPEQQRQRVVLLRRLAAAQRGQEHVSAEFDEQPDELRPAAVAKTRLQHRLGPLRPARRRPSGSAPWSSSSLKPARCPYAAEMYRAPRQAAPPPPPEAHSGTARDPASTSAPKRSSSRRTAASPSRAAVSTGGQLLCGLPLGSAPAFSSAATQARCLPPTAENNGVWAFTSRTVN